MKRIKTIITIAAVLCIAMNSNTTPLAAKENTQVKEPYVNYSIETEGNNVPADAALISEDSYIEDGRQITVIVYKQADGTIITDTLSVSAMAAYSKNGTDTATRTRTISGWGSITITASFKWYTEGLFSYVKCTSMSASRSLDSKVVVSTWQKSYTKDYVSIGKAKAQVEYYFYNSTNPTQYQDGTFKITCTDSGTISDNN